jgi:xanthine/uracil/vitamin C permease (AzgA family)
MKDAFYALVAAIAGVIAWAIDDKVMVGFSIGVFLTVCLYNHDRLTIAIARLIDRATGYR